MTPNLTACHRNYRTSHFLAELDIEILLSNFISKDYFRNLRISMICFSMSSYLQIRRRTSKILSKRNEIFKVAKRNILHDVAYNFILIHRNIWQFRIRLMRNCIEQYSFWNKRIRTKADEIIIIDFSDVDHSDTFLTSNFSLIYCSR